MKRSSSPARASRSTAGAASEGLPDADGSKARGEHTHAVGSFYSACKPLIHDARKSLFNLFGLAFGAVLAHRRVASECDEDGHGCEQWRETAAQAGTPVPRVVRHAVDADHDRGDRCDGRIASSAGSPINPRRLTHLLRSAPAAHPIATRRPGLRSSRRARVSAAASRRDPRTHATAITAARSCTGDRRSTRRRRAR